MACDCPDEGGGRGDRPTLFTFGAGRSVTIKLPDGYNQDQSYWVFLVLHGRGSTPAAVLSQLRLENAHNLDDGAIVVAPEALSDSGTRAWKTPTCCWFGPSTHDDSADLRDLLDQIIATYNVAGVIVMGHSNGGFMSHMMAAEHSDIIRGVATLCGSFPTQDGSGFAPTDNVHVLIAHTTGDTLVKYEGNAGTPSAPEVPQVAYAGAEATGNFWATFNGAGARGAFGGSFDYDAEQVGSESQSATHATAPADGSITVIRMGTAPPPGSGDHAPNLGTATVLTWELFLYSWLRMVKGD